MVLVGRSKECTQLDDLLASARQGLSGVLVVRGEAGVGKTALLDFAVRRADDFTVFRLTGVESEKDLGFAALHRLLAPMLDEIRRLPEPQREALNSALGLASGPPANPFLVGLGLMNVTASVTTAGGQMLCVVDDAQWVDSESISAFAFWARRLQADRVALVFGERGDAFTASAIQGVPTLDVAGLKHAAARELLVSEVSFQLHRDVADRILTESEGNPLAIIEMAKGLTPDTLARSAALPRPLPLTRRLEERFAGQVRSLPADARRFLLLVAADTSDDAALVWTAADRLSVSRDAAELAEAADLVSLGSPIRYRHPLIRSAVYSAASPAERREVHSALAAATAPVDVERRAWHRAAAAVGPDAAIAALLEGCAHRAIANGASAAAMPLLNRAAELTPDREQAAVRLVAAAEVAVAGGLHGDAHIFVEQATPGLSDPVWRARAERADGLATQREGNLAAGALRLRSAAIGLLPSEPRLGRRTLLEAMDSSLNAGGDAVQSEFMQSIAEIPAPRAGVATVEDWLLDAFSTHARNGYSAAVPQYQTVVALCRDAPPEALAPWAGLIATFTRSIWDDTGHDLLLARIAESSRAQGALLPLWISLLYLAGSAVWQGRLQHASALFAQAADVMSASGQFAPPGVGATLDATKGSEAEVLAKVASRLGGTLHRSQSYAGHSALLELYVGRAKYQEALTSALVLFDADASLVGPHVLPDMVEAAMRLGDRTAAEQAIARLRERATAAGTPWSLGLLARSEALMAGAEAEEHFARAIESLSATTMELQLARAHLVYGEWLRRVKRIKDARDHLREAYDMFAAMGAEGFAERAEIELRASGERARKRSVETSTDLTPQEAQISELVAEGATNVEIAAKLFISSSTVEYHLHKVFRKLGVKSRTQLARQILASSSPLA